MKFYEIPGNVSLSYTYKGLRLNWTDISSANYYVVLLNTNNDPVNGAYNPLEKVIDTPNEYTIVNNLLREPKLIPYIKINGYTNDISHTITNVVSLTKTITVSGEHDFSTSNKLIIYESTANDNVYTIVSSIINVGSTDIVVEESVEDGNDGRLFISDPLTTADITIGPFTVRIKPRPEAREIARRLDIIFKARYGDSCKVRIWHRRTHGEKCTTCWDVYENVSKDVDCLICYGTGYKGGYVGPEEMYVTNIKKSINGVYDSRGNKTANNDNLLRGIGNMDAYVVPNDIIIDNLGQRYLVVSVTYTSIDKTVITSQALTLQQLSANDIAYKLGET